MSEESDEIRRRITNEGFPLQRYTAKVLLKLGWLVDEEYPVLQQYGGWYETRHGGLFRDHIVRVGGSTIRTSEDIRALYTTETKGYAIRTCVSCKRQYNIDWVFMKSLVADDTLMFIRLVKPVQENNVLKYNFPFYHNYWKGSTYPVCNIPTSLYNRNNKVREEDKILQTSDNIYFEILQSMEDDQTNFYQGKIPVQQIIYIPIVVTAAKIHSYDIIEKNFDVQNSDAVNLTQVPYLLYEHRIPKDMREQISDSDNRNTDFDLDKLYIFVVYYKYLESFYSSLMNYFAKQTITLPNHLT